MSAPSSPTASQEGLSPEQVQNIAIGKMKKDAGDQHFKSGDLQSALRGYHEALLYFRGVNKQNPVAPPEATAEKKKSEVDELMEKVYSNISACHVKQQNWVRAIEAANKALLINENNFKALFRKGKAQGELGFFEKAEKTLEDLLKRNPADAPTINAEIAQLRAKDKEREKRHNQKLRGFLSRDKDILTSTTSTTATGSASVDPPVSATIEEVTDN